MMSESLTIGCHLSPAKGYLAMAEQATSIGADTFQFFTRNPRGGKAKDIDPIDVADFTVYCEENAMRTFLAHAPYTLNPASADPRIRGFAAMVLTDDLKRMESTPGQFYNLHPGSHVKQGVAKGIDLIVELLDGVLERNQSTTVLLETMSGKGSEVGACFEELEEIISRVALSDHLGICLDTCHVWDAGYDIATSLDEVLSEFDATVGLSRLAAIHLNDSANACGTHRDRHAKIGEGMIGFTALSALTTHPALRRLPFILETPNELEGYADEIARLRAAWL